jgi:hypothetical protein
MKLKDLREKAKAIHCIVKTNGDMDLQGNKLYALYCQHDKTRVSPFCSLPEWSKFNRLNDICLNYIAKQNGVTK